MSKSNPLFVDSTRFSGDEISTRFEITGLFLYDDEKAFIEVKDSKGVSRIEPLRYREKDEQHIGHIFLPHQQEIECRVLIERNKSLLYSSKPFQANAAYVISHHWQIPDDQIPDNQPDNIVAPSVDPLGNKPLIANKKNNPSGDAIAEGCSRIQSLIKAFGL